MATIKKTVNKIFYKTVKNLDETQKCPPQAKLIVDTIAAAENQTISREELLTLLKRPPEEGGLKTEQTAEKIVAFYRPRLIEQGVLEVFEVPEEIEVEVPDKPEKAKKEKPAKNVKVKVKKSEKAEDEATEDEESEEEAEAEEAEAEEAEAEAEAEVKPAKPARKGSKKVAA